MTDDEDVEFYTGLLHWDALMPLYNMVNQKTQNLNYGSYEKIHAFRFASFDNFDLIAITTIHAYCYHYNPFRAKFRHVCSDPRPPPPPPNNPISARGATSFPRYHSFPKRAIDEAEGALSIFSSLQFTAKMRKHSS